MFLILGAIIGLPLSYFLQSKMIQMYTRGFSNYVMDIGDLLTNSKTNTMIFVSIGIFSIVGFMIGYFLDKKSKK